MGHRPVELDHHSRDIGGRVETNIFDDARRGAVPYLGKETIGETEKHEAEGPAKHAPVRCTTCVALSMTLYSHVALNY